LFKELTSGLLALVLLGAADSAQKPAPPAIRPEGVINAASLMPAQFPGGAIAPGSQFRILGVRLAPAESGAGVVSVRVRQGAAIADAVVKSATSARIDAILPVRAPAGDVSLTVSYAGLTSAPVAVRIAKSSFGIFTENAAGWGPATTSTAAPGEIVTIRGTGLGSERQPEVIVGGRRASRVPYAGPSRRGGGEDEIRFEIPGDAPQGCYVPLEVRSGGIAGNMATIAIAPKGRVCEATAPWLRGDSLVLLLRNTMQSPRFGDWTVDLVAAGFGPAPMRMLPPPGLCTEYAQIFSTDDLDYLLDLRSSGQGWLNIRGPQGSKSVTKGARGPFEYFKTLGGATPGRRKPEPLFLEPGDYTIRGWGDPAAGRFEARASVPPPLVWTNRSELETVDRGRPLTAVWSNTGADDLVVVIAAALDQANAALGLSACVAPAGAGRFTIPAARLARLPAASGSGGFTFGLVALARLPAQVSPSGGVAAASASLDSRTVDFR
jgi:uncharacterized protein (TIGR03437 family)